VSPKLVPGYIWLELVLPPRLLIILLIVFPWCATPFGERPPQEPRIRPVALAKERQWTVSWILVFFFFLPGDHSRPLSQVLAADDQRFRCCFSGEELNPCSSSRLSKLVKRLRGWDLNRPTSTCSQLPLRETQFYSSRWAATCEWLKHCGNNVPVAGISWWKTVCAAHASMHEHGGMASLPRFPYLFETLSSTSIFNRWNFDAGDFSLFKRSDGKWSDIS